MYRKNVAGQFIYFQLVNATTGAGLTGATVATRVCIDGTFGAGGGTVTEDTGAGSSPGFYKYALAQADTNGNDIAVAFTATSAIPVEKTFLTTAANPADGVRLGLTSLPNAAAAGVAGLPVLDANSLVDADVKRWLAGIIPAQAAAGIPDINVKNWNNAAVGALPTNFSALLIDAGGNVSITSNVKKNAASRVLFIMTDSTNHAPATGLTVASTRSIDGAAFVGTANAVTEVGNGLYSLVLAAADTNGNDIDYRFTAAGADDVNIEFVTQP